MHLILVWFFPRPRPMPTVTRNSYGTFHAQREHGINRASIINVTQHKRKDYGDTENSCTRNCSRPMLIFFLTLVIYTNTQKQFPPVTPITPPLPDGIIKVRLHTTNKPGHQSQEETHLHWRDSRSNLVRYTPNSGTLMLPFTSSL